MRLPHNVVMPNTTLAGGEDVALYWRNEFQYLIVTFNADQTLSYFFNNKKTSSKRSQSRIEILQNQIPLVLLALIYMIEDKKYHNIYEAIKVGDDGIPVGCPCDMCDIMKDNYSINKIKLEIDDILSSKDRQIVYLAEELAHKLRCMKSDGWIWTDDQCTSVFWINLSLKYVDENKTKS